MKHRNLKAIGLALVGSLVMAAGASAAPTAATSVGIAGQGSLYKEVKKPVNLSLNADITPGAGDTTLLPLMEASFNLPTDLSFNPDPNMPVCTEVNAGNSNFSGATAISLCPNSIVGDGTANIMLAGQVAALITDPELTIFNGGVDSSGGGVLAIHAYSASTNAGIFMSGAIQNGTLDVLIPRLTADSATSTFTLNIPGTQGQDKGYAEATCKTGTYTSSATLTLGNRSSGGVVSNETSLNTPAEDTTCTGLAGSAKLNKVVVSGPKKVKKGKKATYKVKITNNGTATAKGVRLKVSGKGVSFNTSAGTVAPAKTKTVNVKLKAKKKGKVKLTFKVTTTNDGGKTVKKTITVK